MHTPSLRTGVVFIVYCLVLHLAGMGACIGRVAAPEPAYVAEAPDNSFAAPQAPSSSSREHQQVKRKASLKSSTRKQKKQEETFADFAPGNHYRVHARLHNAHLVLACYASSFLH